MARLVLEHQGHTSEHRVTGLTTLGRQSTNDIMVLADKASRQHARVVLSNGRFVVEDLGSANGTFVNGSRIQSHVLSNRDEIRIGDAKLTFLDDRSANLEGQTLGNYRIHNRIGQGAMGAVYKATQISMDRIVALKVLREELVRDREYVRGFLNEARTAGKLNHPNIVRIHDFGEAGGVYYFSMEYVNGQTVEEMLKRESGIPVRRALEIARQVAMALEHANGIGILHRDIKPQNIMVDRRGQVKLTDLGLARASRGSRPETGPIMGTPYYLAPEVARERRYDQRSDLYSLGASLFHMVTGRVPFDGPDAVAVIEKHLKAPVPSPRKFDAGIPEPVSNLIELLLAKNPGLRPASASELVRKIDGILEKGLTAAGQKDGELKLEPQAPPKKKAPEKKSSTRRHAPVAGQPSEPKKVVRVIKVGSGSPAAFMMIGALVVAIVGVVLWMALSKPSPQRNGRVLGSANGGGDVMSDAEAERKFEAARRALDRGDHARARELARDVATRSPNPKYALPAHELMGKLPVPAGGGPGMTPEEREAEAAGQLAEIRKLLRDNPGGPDYAARLLLPLIREFRGTAAAAEALRLYRELGGDDSAPEIRQMLNGAAGPESGRGARGGDGGRTGGGPGPGDAKVPAEEALGKASAASVSAEKAEHFHRARRELARFIEDYPDAPQKLRAAELLDRLDGRIRKRMGKLYERAAALSGRAKYAEAEKLLRDVIDNDPIGDHRELAATLLDAGNAAARRTYEGVLTRAKPYLDRHAFDTAASIMRTEALKLSGTEWGGELEAAADSAEISAALIERFAEKLKKRKGRAPQIKIDVGGKPVTAALVDAGPAGLTLSQGRVRTVVPWKDLSVEEMLTVFGVFPLKPEDRLGLGALLFLRAEARAARHELDQARHHPASREKALALIARLDARARVRRLDFSSFNDAEALTLEGQWSMRGERLVHDGSRAGVARLRGVDYRADGFRLSLDLEFLEDVGAFEVQLGPAQDRCVWFSLGSEGYQARLTLGGVASDARDRWKMVCEETLPVSCRVEGNTLTVEVAGKALKPLEAEGLSGLSGPVVFRAQGARLAVDNVVLRQSDSGDE